MEGPLTIPSMGVVVVLGATKGPEARIPPDRAQDEPSRCPLAFPSWKDGVAGAHCSLGSDEACAARGHPGQRLSPSNWRPQGGGRDTCQ